MAGAGKQTITESEMRELVRELRLRAARIRTLAVAMSKEKTSSIEVTGQPMVARGLQSIDGFILSCRRELGEV